MPGLTQLEWHQNIRNYIRLKGTLNVWGIASQAAAFWRKVNTTYINSPQSWSGVIRLPEFK